MAEDAATIVIVDDDPHLRLLVKSHLRASGRLRIVAEASDGQEAVACARELKPTLMVLDVSMPRMDGLEALPLVLEASPETRVVLYSGFDDRGVTEQALRLGALAYIDKSFPVEALAARLLAMLDGPEDSPASNLTTADGSREAATPAPVGHPRDGPPHRVAAEQLRQSEERFRLLVEAVQDYAIFMLDTDGHVASWNAGAERIKGYVADEIIGRHFRVFYPPEVQRVGHPERELAMALRDGSYAEEGWRVRQDGSTFWASVLITAVYDGDGRHVGFAKVTRDMTERRHLEEAREHALTELAAANEKLRQAAEDQSRFLAVAAHELRTPIGVLAGAADTVRQHLSELTDPERADILDAMGSSAGRVRRLLNDLLTASRLQASALTLQREPVLVETVMARALATITRAWPDAAVEAAQAPTVTIHADPDRVSQALENLLTNALRHGAPPVHLDTRTVPGAIDICVSDSGEGVAPEIRPRLFERFATGPRRGGTGLGLYIVRELAVAHGGDAFYERDAGVDGPGTFVLRLPRGSDVTAPDA
jgi:PAS domain S-box-containing protein